MRWFHVIWLFACPAVHLAADDLEFFEARVRPLLVERCYECHGEEKQKGGLRLDSRAGVLNGGDLGPAIVPGKPEESLLVKAVSWLDPDLQMPPKNRLKPEETATLIEWISRGAPDPRTDSHSSASKEPPIEAAKSHWAYQPLSPLPPSLEKELSSARTRIDYFIREKLNQRNLTPAAPADKATILRRAYYDLTGLPPSPEELEEFQQSSISFEAIVDRLLASPHFGERWGRHWLDVVRYAESVTLRGLVFPEAWRYRDYVIDSFNRDLPFSQFIREQIAGDLLEQSTLEDRHRAMAATTFLVLGNFNYEEQDKEQLRMDIVDDQLDTIGKAFLGQTLGCARCHDHKFDPIPAADYYAMAGILRSTVSVKHANVSSWLEIPLPMKPDEEERVKEHERKVAELNRQIRKKTEALGQLTASGAAHTTAVKDLAGIVIDDSQAIKVGEWMHSQFNKPYIGDGYLHDENSGKGSKTLTFLPELAETGTYEVRLAYTSGGNRASKASVTILHSAGETVVEINQRAAPPIDGHFVSLGKFHFEQGNQGYVLISNADADGHVIADAVQFLREDMTSSLVNSPAKGDEKAAAAATAELKALREELAQLTKSGPVRPMVMSVKEDEKPGDTFIHIRGSVHTLGQKVPRGFLRFGSEKEYPPLSESESGRRELAEWLASPENPLTARVMVNRVWHWLFDSGLVRTTDNFGTTGESPSHPELLDYLAFQFINEGWSVKKLVREIMLSETYQRSSAADPAVLQEDVENRWFARANRRRLPAEAMRDTILAISGKIDLAMGGPTFTPGTKADFGYLDQSTRRSVYVPVFRNALPEIFELFDFADPGMVTGQRNESTVAPQALFFLNHPFILEQSRFAAERLLAIPGLTPEDRIKRIYLLALQRPPASPELQVALAHVTGAPGNTEPGELWTELCQAIFASADFRFLN